jgi:hypothetical protein
MISPIYCEGIGYIHIIPVLICVTAIYSSSIAFRDHSYIF